MATLRVILDAVLSEARGEAGYARELTRALLDTMPAGCMVVGVTSAVGETEVAALAIALPGLVHTQSLSLGRRELSVAWGMGAKLPSLDGMVHSPTLLAPLSKHERHGENQVVVTLHDAAAWVEAEQATPAEVFWNTRLLKRVRKFADAVVVPTHAVADSLAGVVNLGDRVRVISPAVSPDLVTPGDAVARARTLRLPERYAVVVGNAEPRKGLAALFEAMGSTALESIPLVVVAPGPRAAALHELMMQVGVPEHRVTVVGDLGWSDYALAIARAAVLIAPSLDAGFGLPVVEAFKLGTPVVHSDAPALVEVAGGAGLRVERQQPGFPGRLAEAVRGLLDDETLAARLRVLGEDRAKAYSWHDTASRVWQLHADL